MAFCPSCGAKAGSGIKFCPKCGGNMAGGGGGAGTNISLTHNILAALCFIIIGAIILYGTAKTAEAKQPALNILAGIPVAILCFYVGFESYNKKVWAQKWGVIFGATLVLSNWAVFIGALSSQNINWFLIISFLAMVGATIFAYMGKALYTVEDAENPLAKLTL